MARRNRRRPVESGPLGGGSERREAWGGDQYVVRALSGAASEKAYRCPGCDQLVRPGVAHVVAWPAVDAGAAGRRHWHAACWAARGRRAPVVRRPGSAPRF